MNYQIMDLMHEPDERDVVLTGREPKVYSKDGHVRFDVRCPFHEGRDASCWVHFGMDGNGRFVCKPCRSVGIAEHGVERGKRVLTLSLRGRLHEGDDRWGD